MAQNYDVGNIELNIKSSASESLKAFDEVIKKVEDLQARLGGLTSSLQNVGDASKEIGTKTRESSKDMNEFDKSVQEVGKSSEKTGNSLRKALTIGGALLAAKKVTQMVGRGIEDSAQMIQNYRLLQISSKGYFDQALDFQNKMSSTFGINPSESMGLQGYFATLTGSLGIADGEVNTISESLTKLSYDLGSLFGDSPDSMGEKIKAGLIGQTKPLRNLGIDVTQQTIQGYLDNMGLDVLVQDLTQAEKVLLRYISIIDQSQLAHGNLANSIELPSQQIQMLKSQLKELSMWLYTVFIGTIGKILPYINGFVMAIKEMVKALAMLFGFKLADFGFNEGIKTANTGIGQMASGVGDVGKAADKSASKIKKMMGLMGFNEIHNVKEPSDPAMSGGGAGGGGIGGIGGGGVYDDLLAQLAGYDNLMGEVSTKASAIRDKLFDWLGITKLLNDDGSIAGLSWSFKDMSFTAKLASIALGALVGVKVAGWISALWGAIKGSKIVGWFGKFFGVLKGTAPLQTMAGKFAALTSKVLPVAGGVATAVGAFKAFKLGRVLSETGDLDGKMGELAGSLALTTIGGAAIGSAFGPVGAVIGGVAGAVVGLGSAFAGWGFAKPIEDVNNFNGVTEETVEKMKPFEKSFKDLDKVFLEMEWTDALVDDEDVDTIKGHLDQIGDYLNTETIAKAEKAKQDLINGDVFQGLDPNIQGKLVKQLDDASALSQEKTNELTSRVQTILETASKGKRKLTKEESAEISKIQDELYSHGVKTLSASQTDQETIMKNMKKNKLRLSAEESAQLVKDAIDTRNNVINEAEDKYDEAMNIAKMLRADGTEESRLQAEEIEENALREKNETIRLANEKHAQIMEGAEKHSGKYWKLIDKDTGETLSQFGAMTKSVKGYFSDMNKNILSHFSVNSWRELATKAVKALGDSLWRGVTSIRLPSLPRLTFPKISLPTFKMDGKFGLAPPSVPKLSMSWRSYKDGGFVNDGFPDGENGAFFANDRELIGKFTNGKTAVANNDQIVEGIQSGVYSAVVEAMANSNSGDSGDIIINLDSRTISKHQKRRDLELEMIRG